MHLHVPAIGYPKSRVTYVGIDPPRNVTSQYSLIDGEQARGFGLWVTDPYGVGPLLGQKRKDRGWDDTRGIFSIGGKMEQGSLQALILSVNLEEGVRELLEWQGGVKGEKIFRGEVPWDEKKLGDGQDGNAKKWPAVNDADRE